MENTKTFITKLSKSRLYTDCPHCGCEFSLGKALLFDGTKKFPEKAELVRLEKEKEIKDRLADLLEQQNKTTSRSEKAAISVGIGKIIEKILPTHKNFNISAADCRFLAEPIDMIVFDGASQDKINNISFMEVKTGAARLNTHQKMVRDIVEDHKVKWREM